MIYRLFLRLGILFQIPTIKVKEMPSHLNIQCRVYESRRYHRVSSFGLGSKVVLKRGSLNGTVACLVHESRRYHHMFAVASEERVMSTKSSLTGTCYIFNTGIRWYHHIWMKSVLETEGYSLWRLLITVNKFCHRSLIRRKIARVHDFEYEDERWMMWWDWWRQWWAPFGTPVQGNHSRYIKREWSALRFRRAKLRHREPLPPRSRASAQIARWWSRLLVSA